MPIKGALFIIPPLLVFHLTSPVFRPGYTLPRHSPQTPKMHTSTLSIMDKSPNLESFYRNLSLLATAALAVHISWTYDSCSDSLSSWLVSAMPTILTGFILIGLLLYVFDSAGSDQDTRFFSLTTTSKRSGHAGKIFRISCDPAREDRHIFDVQVITITAGLGVSIDLIYVWYLLCRQAWGELAKELPNLLLFFVTLFTGFLVLFLCATWAPVWGLMQTRRSFVGELVTEVSEDGDTGLSPRLKTLIAAAEVYEKCLRPQIQPSNSKVKVIGEFLDVLRKW